MIKIKYDLNLLGLMNAFEKITRAKLIDCFIDDNELLTFIVEKNNLRKAIGKNGTTVKKLEDLMKRKIKVVENSLEMLKLIQNYIYPLRVDDIREENRIVIMKSQNTKTKGLLIGRQAKNLRNLEKVVNPGLLIGTLIGCYFSYTGKPVLSSLFK